MISNARAQVVDTGIPAGPFLRTPTAGPELELVYRYLAKPLGVSNADWAQVAFVEPRIESGFPDIVLVQWDTHVTRHWPKERISLSTADIRLLHTFYQFSNCSLAPPSIRGRKQLEAIERLAAADVLTYQNGDVRLRPLYEIFAVRRLISIEAKVTDMRSGLEQAIRNTWFASESYLLTPQLPRSTDVIKDAARFGIGLITIDMSPDVTPIPARCETLPKSYVSWQFNEWAWRSSLTGLQGAGDCLPRGLA